MAAVPFRFADLSGGTARLNGRDLAGYDPDDVRAVITGCAADPHIFDATIRDNLRLARRRRLLPALASPADWRRPGSLLPRRTGLNAHTDPHPATGPTPLNQIGVARRGFS